MNTPERVEKMLQHDQFCREELGPLDSLCINFCDSGYQLLVNLWLIMVNNWNNNIVWLVV